MAVVLGLAIADMATSLHKLLRNRRRVRWDWVLAQVAPYFVVMVLLFLTASAALPDEVPEEGIDLGRYFDENRGYFLSLYGTYITVWIGSWTIADIAKGATVADLLGDYYFDYPWIVACFILVFVRLPRWTSGAFLLITLGWLLYGYGWWSKPLTGPA